MENTYVPVMAFLSDEELERYIRYPEKYVPDAIEAAVAELKKRGRNFTAEEETHIRQIIQQRREAWKYYDIQEPVPASLPDFPVSRSSSAKDMPSLYPESALYIISLLFNPFFASILLALNCQRTGKREGVLVALGFGFLYMMMTLLIISLLKLNIYITLIFNVVGALLLHQWLWKKYLGQYHAYQPKPIWGPLLIFLLITVPLLLIAYLHGGWKLPS
ncbi:hypothetical protein BXY57_0960 [Thermoflavifilum aggregans]|uniref:Uncharacterized protein n=1 Tax=Thermoflavifilum aggregans TaxID=454188 RepID=A0A2M9CTY3_9BACT|nr:hypothetical protein [Thermoflavifilum aggregans]PJJ75384.1 hypothetical protein BXY57_0960 [Thermoflavifilum aggregans]